MAGIAGAARQVGPAFGPVLKKRAAQSAAAVAGSKNAAPPAKAPAKPQLPGILGTLRGIAQKKTGRGGKLSKR